MNSTVSSPANATGESVRRAEPRVCGDAGRGRDAKLADGMAYSSVAGYMDVAGRDNKKSEKYVFGRRKENARAAGFTPYTMIRAVGLGPDVIAGMKLLVIDHQLAVKQIQFFHSGMTMRRIVGSRREPYQHTDAVFLH